MKGSAGEVAAPMSKDQINYATREPYGVVAAIVPFNFPLLLTAWKIAPALAAGNTVVIKPPHQNPLSNLLMAKLYDGMPKGVVNVVTGAGETGALLTSHPDVRVVAFTGSSKVGAMIASEAGKGLKKVHLELGGLDPSVVFADADVDAAVKELAWSRGLNAGQVCTSPKRIIVDEKIADQFISKLVERVKNVKVGDPLDPTTDMGPMVNKEARAALQAQLDKTLAEGGELLYQAKAPAGQKGAFFMPAVVKVKEGMTAAKEEMFGPVYTILVAKGEDDAIRMANSTDYALGASAFTTSQRLTHRARTELVGGTVWINRTQDNSLGLSFGGPYQSGRARARQGRPRVVHVEQDGRRVDGAGRRAQRWLAVRGSQDPRRTKSLEGARHRREPGVNDHAHDSPRWVALYRWRIDGSRRSDRARVREGTRCAVARRDVESQQRHHSHEPNLRHDRPGPEQLAREARRPIPRSQLPADHRSELGRRRGPHGDEDRRRWAWHFDRQHRSALRQPSRQAHRVEERLALFGIPGMRGEAVVEQRGDKVRVVSNEKSFTLFGKKLFSIGREKSAK